MAEELEIAQLRQRISRRLQELGISAIEAANRAGLKRDFILDFLNGKKKSFATAKQKQVAAALNWNIEQLAGPSVSGARETRRSDQPKMTIVPLLDRVTAGVLKSPSSQIPIEEARLLAFSDLGSGQFFALQVEGDSMDRYSPEGSIIVVNKNDRRLISGKCYVFDIKGEVTYKMWQAGKPSYLAPHSTNALNKPIFFERKRDLQVIGRVRRTVFDL